MNASMKAEPGVQADGRRKEAGPERHGKKIYVGPASYKLMPLTDKSEPKTGPGSNS